MCTRTTSVFMFLSILALSNGTLAGEARVPRRLLEAIREVETGAQPAAGRNAVGDQGRSLGPYQIQKAYWHDSGIAGRYEDVRNPRYAERVMLAYWQRYCPSALARGDWQTLARVHNGGPGGEHKPAALKYWQKVKRILENAEKFTAGRPNSGDRRIP